MRVRGSGSAVGTGQWEESLTTNFQGRNDNSIKRTSFQELIAGHSMGGKGHSRWPDLWGGNLVAAQHHRIGAVRVFCSGMGH